MIPKTRRRAAICPRRALRLTPLENRVVPAAFNSLVSQADPSFGSDAAGGDEAQSQSVSADGRYIVFASSAGNLVPGQMDKNGGEYLNSGDDIFVFDRVANSTELISHSILSNLTTANGSSFFPAISADGRYVTFVSFATDLINGFTSGGANADNLYLCDRLLNSCTLVTHKYGEPTTGQDGTIPILYLSPNGQVVAFSSYGTDLLPGPPLTSGLRNTYAYSVSTGNMSLINHKLGYPNVPVGGGYPFGISADGRYVVTIGIKLASQNDGSSGNVYRYDVSTGNNFLISKSVTTGNLGGNAKSYRPSISDDGKRVCFVSSATNLVSGYSGIGTQIFLWDGDTTAVCLVSHDVASTSAGGTGDSILPVVSADGRYVAYPSLATNLINGFVDNNGTSNRDVFLYDSYADQTILASRQYGTSKISGNGLADTSLPSISADGSILLFGGRSTNLVAGFVGSNDATFGDMFAFYRTTGTVELVDHADGQPSVSGNAYCESAQIDADGTAMVFATASSNIMANLTDTNGATDIFVRDVTASAATLVTRRFGAPSLSAGSNGTWVQESADGRYAVYTSLATNVVAGQADAEGSQDVFLYDRQTNTTTLVSHAYDSATSAATGDIYGYNSAIPVISADGRYVAYASNATNLVQGFVDGNGTTDLYSGTDIYLFDRISGQNTLVSHNVGSLIAGSNGTSGTYSPYPDYLVSISADGRYVAYRSQATNLVSGQIDNNGPANNDSNGSDIFVYDRTTGLNALVSHIPSSLVATGNDHSFAPSISGDGRYIAFWSYSYTMVTGMAAVHRRNVFVYDRQTGVVSLASHNGSSVVSGANGDSNEPAISKDGNFVVYQSASNNIVTGGTDPNNSDDIFLYDVQTKANVLVSHAYNSAVNAGSLVSRIDAGGNTQAISDDGRYVVYASNAANLISGFVDGNGVDEIGDTNNDVFLFDRVTGINTLISHKSNSLITGGNGDNSTAPEISGDGRFVAFESTANDLVSGFSSSVANNYVYGNLYLYDRLAGANTLMTHTSGSVLVGGDSEAISPTLSRDGSVVSYLSGASNLVPGDFNSHQDIFAYVTPPAHVQSLQIADGSAQRSLVRSLTVTFDQAVTFAGDPSAAFAVTNSMGGAVVSAQWSVASNSQGQTVATANFSGPLTEFGSLKDGNYQLTIHANQVTGYIGNLDGDGDGVAGGDYVASFHRLYGDVNGDRHVDAADFLAFRLAFQTNNMAFDFDGDGTVNAADFLQFRLRFLQAI